MRHCQICGPSGKRVILNDYDNQPMCLFECTTCGHRYLDFQDKHRGQAWLDEYYRNVYRTDDAPYSAARLDSLADFIASQGINEIFDIGGMDGELQRRLAARGVNCIPLGVGFGQIYTPCVLSHTLEHIYDIGELFARIQGTTVIAEIPIHLEYVAPRDYDYHWQHINKFRPSDIERLFEQKGYNVSISTQIEDYREYKVWRIAGRK